MWKILIADDEEIECRGLEMMIRKNFKMAELLPSVYNGVDLIKKAERFQPDVILADINMPGLNGLEALEMLRLKALNAKVIINTAYNDFAYIRKALQLGASDFLSKPVYEEELVKAISKVLGVLEQEKRIFRENQISEKKFQDMQSALGNGLMSSILLGQPKEEELRLWFDNLDQTFLGGILVLMQVPDNRKVSVYLEVIRKMVQEELKRFCISLTMVHKETLYLFLIPGGEVGEENYQPWSRELLEMLRRKIRTDFECEAVFGVSRWKYEFEKMPEGLKECRMVLNDQRAEAVCFFEKREKIYSRQAEDLELTEDMADAVRRKDSEAAKEILQKIFTQWKAGGQGLWQEQRLAAAFIQKCQEELESGKRRHFFWRQLLERLQSASDETQLQERVLAVLWELPESKRTETIRNEYVEEAVLYIENNYMKDISLEAVAERLGISSFYLSRLLTQQLDESFVELLTDARIDHAIRLIRDEDFIVKDIGARVGYLSPTYFYKVFKKNTGMTVGEMRRLLRGL